MSPKLKSKHRLRDGFSLVEVVLALGIFAFCIIVLLGLMPVGLRAARSVYNESNAVNLGESILAGWRMQKSKTAPLTIPGIATNLPPLSTPTRDLELLFDSRGQAVSSITDAALKLLYTVEPSVGTSTVRMKFWWPPLAPTNTAQTRSLVQVFSL